MSGWCVGSVCLTVVVWFLFVLYCLFGMFVGWFVVGCVFDWCFKSFLFYLVLRCVVVFGCVLFVVFCLLFCCLMVLWVGVFCW